MKFKGDTYTKAYKLLSVESNWTQLAMARDTNRNVIALEEENEDRICKVCLIGALRIVYGYSQEFIDISRKLIESTAIKKHGHLFKFNDHPDTTYDTVYNFLKENNI